jgi:hypothetical protein
MISCCQHAGINHRNRWWKSVEQIHKKHKPISSLHARMCTQTSLIPDSY